MRQIRAKLDSQVGVLCLSRNPDSILMWAHYCDSYKGALVGFDENHEFFEDLVDVVYSDVRPTWDIEDMMSDSPILLSELTVKPSVWAYEQEVRLYRSLSICRDRTPRPKLSRREKKEGKTTQAPQYPVFTMDFPRESIVSIALGARMSDEDLRSIWKEADDLHHAWIGQAIIAESKYELRREPIRIPGISSPAVSPRNAHLFVDVPGAIGEVARWQRERNPYAELVKHRA